MRNCPKCGNAYSDTYQFCPADGTCLTEDGKNENTGRQEQVSSKPQPAQISIRTLMLGLGILLTLAVMTFTAVFFYQYWKPKYGNLEVKTTPSGALIYLDGNRQGNSPIALEGLLSGGHQLKAVKEGYDDYVQQVIVIPYATESLLLTLEPLVPQLSNEQLAEIESWKKKLDSAKRDEILLPPPDDYNVLYFADQILSIDPANEYAQEEKNEIVEQLRRLAGLAYAGEDWLEAEKQYKNLALIFPDDITISERLIDISDKINASIKDREKQIEYLKAKAEAALNSGNLLPPDKDNALDAILNIQRLDKKNIYAQESLSLIKEQLQNRGDRKIAVSDWEGARDDFRLTLRYFPGDSYSKKRLSTVESKLAEAVRAEEQQRQQRVLEKQQFQQRVIVLRQSALNSYGAKDYQRSISEWQEYLEYEPASDEAYFYIGASYQDLKQWDTAILNYEKCISLNPEHPLAHLNLGRLYRYHRDNLKLAEEHFQKVAELGGAEEYTPERIENMIQELRDLADLNKLLKMPFAVEHKHLISSCKGNLHFSEEGVEFRTTETDHSFYETYNTLRAFEIGEDSLAIRTRNNKTYNFRLLIRGDGSRIRNLASHYTLVTTKTD